MEPLATGYSSAVEVLVDAIQIVSVERDTRELIRSMLGRLRDWTGCEAAGVRLREGDDYPYFQVDGFPSRFVELESSLCEKAPDGSTVRDDAGHPVLDCMCGNVLRGRTDPSKPFFTPAGSFCSNCTSELLASTTDEERLTRTRNRCNAEGFESVALIPLRASGDTIGLLQLVDSRRDRFDEVTIATLERVAGALGAALAERRATDALRVSQERYRALFEENLDGVLMTSPDGAVLDANSTACALLGLSREEVCSRGRKGLLDPSADYTDYHAERERTGRVAGTITFVRKDGSLLPTEFSSFVVHGEGGELLTFVIFRDISARLETDEHLRRSEENLRQSQKMEAVGRLAGGIAHDFNNVLTAIIGYSDLLLDSLEEGPDGHREDVAEIRLAAERAASLTRQILAFSRRQTLKPVVASLNEIVTGAERLLGRTLGEDILLLTDLEAQPGLVEVDVSQMEQVLMNLAVNARDAMPGGGTLVIATSDVRARGDVGAQVMLRVSDTGAGMDEETKARAFEPFFTTKEKGKGTGLGLSTVYGIVNQSGGSIFIQSDPGKGTTIEIFLPRLERAAPDAAPDPPDLATFAGTETILLVEDEPAVRALAGRVLRTLGYTVLEAESGDDGLMVVERESAALDLLVTDMVLPGQLQGGQLADVVRTIRADLPILFMSGYNSEVTGRAALREQGGNYLEKPFTPSVLARCVRQALDRR